MALFLLLWLFSPNLEQKLFYAQWRSSSDNWRSRPSPHFYHSVNAKLLHYLRFGSLAIALPNGKTRESSFLR
ncbi:MAG: hypothetical protein QNJ34_28240 [Xenococcaceae cyanobacterium MO_188.B29]|nr:hypothetical protein [Xenococcaceae cyanobacterium MO_188.B29]